MDLKPEHWVKHPEQADIELKNQDDETDAGEDQEDADRADSLVEALAEELPDLPFTLGRVRVEKASGAAFLLADDMLTIHGLTAPQNILRRSTLARPHAPVWLGDRLYARVDRIRYDRTRHGLIAYFTPLHPSERINLSRCIAIPLLADAGFSCGRCGVAFQTGSRPCSCVETASAYVLQKVSVMGVRLWDQRKDKGLGDKIRSEMLSHYFGGAVSFLQFSEPI